MKKAIIDIDGVLNDYPMTQISFFNDTYGTAYGKSIKTLSELKNLLSYNQYSKLKEEYRNSEYKHNAKAKDYAKELLQYLRDNDYLIYITTARKLFKDNQLEKTICWLKKNNLIYDYIYCSQKKDFTIFEKFGDIDLVIEDNCDNLINIEKINTNKNAKYFIVNNCDNMRSNTTDNIIRVNSLRAIINFLKK